MSAHRTRKKEEPRTDKDDDHLLMRNNKLSSSLLHRGHNRPNDPIVRTFKLARSPRVVNKTKPHNISLTDILYNKR